MSKNSQLKQQLIPNIIIEGLDNRAKKLPLKKDKLIIGRLKSENDISLEPDPQKLVTRYMHCSIEYEINAFWVIDNASKNGTFLKHQNQVKRICGKERLTNNDSILILGRIENDGTLKYWRLVFNDPQATEDIGKFSQQNYLDYDWIQAKLFLYENNQKNEIHGLSPQEHKLIRFMQQKNINNNNTAVMCSYNEIIEAVWDEMKISRSKNDVNHLIAGLRKKIEPNPDEPKYLINVRGMGYRLITKTKIF